MEDTKAPVYVLAKDGKPLMPCEPVVARLLLKQGKAKVKRREPFTIKLMYESDRYTQPLTLGVDTGSGTFGTAVAAGDGSVLYASEVTVRNDVHERMERRKGYRRTRRGRKTRYRKPRFRNRRNSIRKDRFSPTMVSKQHSHEKEIAFVRSILPITDLIIEGGLFDSHLIKQITVYRNAHLLYDVVERKHGIEGMSDAALYVALNILAKIRTCLTPLFKRFCRPTRRTIM